MKRALATLLLLAATLTLSGCVTMTVSSLLDLIMKPVKGTVATAVGVIPFVGGKDDKKTTDEEAADEGPRKVIGRVRFSHDGFVLIYSPNGASAPAGTQLTTLDSEGLVQNTELKMSAEKKGSFLVADVVSGSPTPGDMVVVVPKKRQSASTYQVLE